METFYKVLLYSSSLDGIDDDVIIKRVYCTDLDDAKLIVSQWSSQFEKEGYKKDEKIIENYCGDWYEHTYFFKGCEMKSIYIDNHAYIEGERFVGME